MALESVTGIAYAGRVLPTEPIRPLHDVWLRPRRVFRELATHPVSAMDYLLGAAQGIAGWLAFSRAQNAGATNGIAEIFGWAIAAGAPLGIASLFFMSAIYSRLASRMGSGGTRTLVFHVLAYGGVPLAASLLIWLITALLVGQATFERTVRPDAESFVALLLRVQFITYALLAMWSVVIQIMGLSEIQGIAPRKAFGIWVLGQLIGFLAIMFLMVLVLTLFPNAAPT